MNSNYVPFNILRTGFSTGSKLQVTTNKKLLSKDLRDKALLGNFVTFLKLIGTQQVSVNYTGKRHYLPIKAVASFKDYTVASKPLPSDTVFMVVAKHDLFQVGTVFETSLIRHHNSLGFYTKEGLLCIIDDSIIALSKVIKTNSKNVQLESLSEKFAIKQTNTKTVSKQNIPEIVITETDLQTVPVAVPSDQALIKDGTIVTNKSVLTDYVSVDKSLFESINKTIDELASDIQGEFVDIKGLTHNSLLACLRSNQLYVDTMYLDLTLNTIKAEIDSRH